jgi:putative (di)nucleoside polyphosphate hydrolase
MNDFASLPYRPCVGVMLVNADGQVFVGQRIDQRENRDGQGDFWQMPQGGVDGRGSAFSCLARTGRGNRRGADQGVILAQTREELLYDLPDS